MKIRVRLFGTFLANESIQFCGHEKSATLRQKESYMKKLDVEKDEKIEDIKQQANENPPDNIFDTEEIRIEELAIDGICGVY